MSQSRSDGRAAPRLSRREILAGLGGVPAAGALSYLLHRHDHESHEAAQLAARLVSEQTQEADALAMPTKAYEGWAKLEDLKGKVPKGRLGKLELSRVVFGGNLMGGWAHARDLLYVSDLVKAYHHRDKVFETLRMAEACGIDTIITNPVLCSVINDYWRLAGGKIQFISDLGGPGTWEEKVQHSIDNGALACYMHGGMADQLVAAGDFDAIANTLEWVRRHDVPAGVCGHHLATPKGCVEHGIIPDFWIQTLHHSDYWSATPTRERSNIWCEQPDETIAFMLQRREPWIAFKVLAAGAIHPRDGFRYAFENGADFICVGMFDFQVVDDVNIALEVLGAKLDRKREWFA